MNVTSVDGLTLTNANMNKIDDLRGDRMDGFIEKLVNIVFGDYYTLKNNKWYYNRDGVELCLTMDEMQDYLLDIIENHIV